MGRGRSLIASLAAPNPSAWLSTHLDAWYAEHAYDDGAVSEVRSLADVLDGSLLPAAHTRLVAAGTTPAAAANYLAGWFGGSVASVVGFGLAAGGCAFLVDGGDVRWHVHPGGWPTRVDVPPKVVVRAGHPWIGLDGVQEGDPDDRALASLLSLCEPIVDACRALAPTGRAGLWNEIGDALATPFAFRLAMTITDEHVARLRALVDRPGVPWKARPRLGFAASDVLGRVHVVQKGGCCLAYTCPDAEASDPYCATCSFRPPADSDAAQVRWLEQRHAGTASDRST